MLVAISGSQGSGKSTVLNKLEEMGHNVVSRKTSRSILTDWGVTLQEVNNNHELTVKFQDEILQRKRLDELPYENDKELWFTERTFADLFTYAVITLGKDNEYSDYIDRYFEACKKCQQLYSRVFYIEGGMFEVEHDGVRGSNQFYSIMADVSMRKFTWMMTSKFTPITLSHIDDRVDFIREVVYSSK